MYDEKITSKDEYLLYQLKKIGAPFCIPFEFDASDTISAPFYEVLADALSLARRNPSVARIYPVLLVRNKERMNNFESLIFFAEKSGELKTLGFFLDLTSELTGITYYSEIADHLPKYNNSEVEEFFTDVKKSKYLNKLEEINTPPIAKKWRFRMNMNTESFLTLLNKYIKPI